VKVLNKRKHGEPEGSVYIGRPSKWGNPFMIGPDGNRAEVLRRFRAYMDEHPALREAAKRELRGKDLVCWCAPLACHGDILMQEANEP
jgi:hypothetical protein